MIKFKFILIPLVVFILFINTSIKAEGSLEQKIYNLERRVLELEKKLDKLENIPSKKIEVEVQPKSYVSQKPLKQETLYDTVFNFKEKISKTGYHRINDNIILDKFIFKVDAFRIDKVVQKDILKRSTYTEKKYAQIYVTITNTSTSIPFEYSTPSGIFTDLTLEDDKGRNYLPANFGFNTVIDGKIEGTVSISPGSKITDLLVFERPNNDAKALLLTFPASQFKQKGKIRVLIPNK